MEKSKAIVLGVGLKTEPLSEVKSSLGELEDLARSAGWHVVGSLTQWLNKWTPATLIGQGKVEEVAAMIQECQGDFVLVDHSLTGIQTRNLEELWKPLRVLDRSQVIIEIFAQRASSYEGKLQVELAQLLDQLPRQVGAWLGSLSRQGGGIGAKGGGEQAIELDRRQIRGRVDRIKKKLKVVRKNRREHRRSREKNRIPSFALIGYTNSGKSSLMNALTKAQVYAQDQLFATLDPITRKVFLNPVEGSCFSAQASSASSPLASTVSGSSSSSPSSPPSSSSGSPSSSSSGAAGSLPSGFQALLTDTVGFINKLPHHLIEAFKATLEESAFADYLLHVIDLSNPQMEKQIQVVEALIQEFGWQDKPLIHVFNKMDKAPVQNRFRVKQKRRVFTSAHTGEGLEELKAMMARITGLMKE